MGGLGARTLDNIVKSSIPAINTSLRKLMRYVLLFFKVVVCRVVKLDIVFSSNVFLLFYPL